MNPKPPDYRARRQWQLAARARGEVPECGREACHAPAEPAWVGSGTGVELLYCAGCAREINRWNPGTCRLEPQPLHAAATNGIAMRSALDAIAATAIPPAEPTMNRAQRRARGDYRPRTP